MDLRHQGRERGPDPPRAGGRTPPRASPAGAGGRRAGCLSPAGCRAPARGTAARAECGPIGRKNARHGGGSGAESLVSRGMHITMLGINCRTSARWPRRSPGNPVRCPAACLVGSGRARRGGTQKKAMASDSDSDVDAERRIVEPPPGGEEARAALLLSGAGEEIVPTRGGALSPPAVARPRG